MLLGVRDANQVLRLQDLAKITGLLLERSVRELFVVLGSKKSGGAEGGFTKPNDCSSALFHEHSTQHGVHISQTSFCSMIGHSKEFVKRLVYCQYEHLGENSCLGIYYLGGILGSSGRYERRESGASSPTTG